MKEKVKKDKEKRKIKSQAEYAELFGVSQNTVSQWLDGRRTPSKQSQMLMTFSNSELKIAAKKAAK